MTMWQKLGRLPFVLGLVASAMFAAVAFPIGVGSAFGSTVPFTDQYAHGLITLCSQGGQPVTSGSLLAEPFVWDAVSTLPASTKYSRGLAYLFAYQPIQYVDPGDWSGEQLSDGSWFSDPSHPIAEATNQDKPLLWFQQAFPARWDGLIELRMYYSSINAEPYTDAYPVAVIRVKGTEWSLVSGGSGPCQAGKATTLESTMAPGADLTSQKTVGLGPSKSVSAKKSSGTVVSKGSGSVYSSGSAGSGGSTTTQPLTRAAQAMGGTPKGSSGGGLSGVGLALILVGAMAVLGSAAGVVLYKRRWSVRWRQ